MSQPVYTASTSASNEEGCSLLLANGLFAKAPLKPAYAQSMEKVFGAKVQSTTEPSVINSWVDAQTK